MHDEHDDDDENADVMPRRHEPGGVDEIDDTPAPPDTVPHTPARGLDPEQRTQLRALDGHPVHVTSTEVTYDSDGIPHALGQRTDRAMLHIPQAARDYWELDEDSTSDGTDAA